MFLLSVRPLATRRSIFLIAAMAGATLLLQTLSTFFLTNTTAATQALPMVAQADGSWVQRGPAGGAIDALLADPNDPAVMFAVVGKTVLISTNTGGTWRPSNNGFGDARVERLALFNSATLFAGTNQGIFRTTNGGNSWNLTSNGLPSNSRVTALAADPTNNRILVGIQSQESAASIYWSTDGGATWRPRTGIAEGTHITSLITAPGNVAFAGTTNQGVYRSNDGGASWNASNAGMVNRQVGALVVDPQNPSILYAGVQGSDSPGDGMVYKSTNSGASWSPTNLPRAGGANGNVTIALAIDRNNPAILYAATERGIHKTSNGGASWTRIVNGLRNSWQTPALLIERGSGNTLWAGTGDGIYQSTNGGENWNLASQGLQQLALNDVLVDPLNADNVYTVSSAGGVYRSRNRGASWEYAPLRQVTPEIASLQGLNLAIDRANPATLYAGSVQLGVYKSTNSGASWASPNEGFARTVERLRVSTDGRVIFQVDSNNNNDISLLRSLDGGRNWQAWYTGNFIAHDLVIDPTNANIVYAGGNQGVVKSVTGSSHWNPASNGLPGDAIPRRLAIAPTQAETLYALLNNGSGTSIYKTTNGGGNWTQVNNGLTLVTNPGNGLPGGITIDPLDANLVYVWGTNGIFRSTNGGGSWNNFSAGLSGFVSSLSIGAEGVLFASTANPGSPGLGNGLFMFQPGVATNTPPTIAATSGLTRQAGAGGSNSIIANVNDAETAIGLLSLSVSNLPAGLTLNNLTNNNGTISATLEALCNAPAGTSSFTLTVTDANGASAITNVTLAIADNQPPVLGNYDNQSATVGETFTLRPTAPPSDNTMLRNVRASISSGYQGTFAFNVATGAVMLGNAAPAGTHTITIEASDNCDAQASRTVQITLTPANTQCLTAPAGLLSWYRGEGNAQDAAGSNDASARGGLTYRPGRVASGFALNGRDAYLEIPDNANHKPQRISVEAWVNFETLDSATATVPGLQYLVHKRNTRLGSFEGYSLLKQRINGVDRLSFIISSAGGTQVSANSTTAIETGRFYHVVGTYDGSALRLYVNGVPEAAQPAAFALDYGTRPLFIGTSGESFFDGRLQGLLDEVSLYNRALEPREVLATYNANAGKCLARLATVSAADYRGEQVAPEEIVAAFGTNLANGSLRATTTPLPTSLLDVTLTVRDSTGIERLAPLFFVSPNQINYLIPAGTAAGIATITTNNGGSRVSGSIIIAPVAPSMFTADASGRGPAAGLALRIAANNTQRYEPLVRFDAAQNKLVTVPLDLSNTSEQVFLVLYGTGIRGRSSIANVTATIGGTNATVLYAGAQGSLVGVDQLNIRLPLTLRGAGEVDVVISADGRTANVVKVNIR